MIFICAAKTLDYEAWFNYYYLAMIKSNATCGRANCWALIHRSCSANDQETTAISYTLHGGQGRKIPFTNPSGNVIESYQYDVFGKGPYVRFNPSTSQPFNCSQSLPVHRKRVAAWVGLYDYRNRVYSAELGRFIQSDPIRFDAGDVNIYRYVANQPTNGTDALGLEFYIDSAIDHFRSCKELQNKLSKLQSQLSQVQKQAAQLTKQINNQVFQRAVCLSLCDQLPCPSDRGPCQQNCRSTYKPIIDDLTNRLIPVTDRSFRLVEQIIQTELTYSERCAR